MSNPFTNLTDLVSPSAPTNNASNPFSNLTGIVSAGAVQDETPQQRIDRLRKQAEDTPNSTLGQFGLSTIQGAVSPYASILRTASRVLPALQSVSNKIDEYIARISPGVHAATSATDANLQGIAQAGGEAFGSYVGTNPLVKGASTLVRGIGGLLPESVAARALSVISDISKYAENSALGAGIGSADASALGGAARNLPASLAGSAIVQGAQNPDALTTPKGAATTIGYGLLDALSLGSKGQGVRSKLERDQTDLPTYAQAAQDKLSSAANYEPQTSLQKTLSNLYVSAVNAQGKFQDLGQKGYQNVVNLSRGSDARVDQFRKVAPFTLDENNNPIAIPGAKSLESILSPLENSDAEGATTGQFNRLALAKTTLDPWMQDLREKIATKSGTNIPQDNRAVTGLTNSEAVQIVANADSKTTAAWEDAVKYTGNLRQYAVDSGALDPATAAQWAKDRPNYIPLNRFGDDINGTYSGVDKGNYGPGNISNRLIGKSIKPIINPIEGLDRLTNHIIYASDRNRVGLEFQNVFDSGNIAGVEKLTGADKFNSPQFHNDVSKLAETAASQYGIDLSEPEAQKLVGSVAGTKYDPDTNILYVKNGPTTNRYKLDADWGKAFQALDPQQLPMFIRLLGLPAQTLRTGTTAALDFSGVNVVRDSWDAQLNSQYGFRLGIDSWKGLMEALGKGKYKGQMLQEYRQAGGGYGLSRFGASTPSTSNISDILPGKSLVTETFAHPIDALKKVTEPFELAARLGEYMLGREQGATAQEALFAARNVTTDFQQRGASPVINGLTQMTAFLNPGIQSIVREGAQLTNKDTAIPTALKGIGAITMPSIALWFANRNDKDINDIRKGPGGATNWYFRLPNGSIGKVPKPFLYGQLFGNTIEAALDALVAKDPSAVDRLGASLAGQVGSNMIPNFALTPLNIYANKDMFTGAPIVAPGQENLDSEAQTSRTTSGLATKISSLLGGHLSPVQVQYVFDQTGGTIGKDVTQLTNKNDLAPSEYMGIRRFVARNPTMNLQSVKSFYDRAAEVEKIVNTIHYYEKNDPDKLEKYVQENGELFSLAPVISETRKQLSTIHDAMNQYNNIPDKDLSQTDKRKMNDYLTGQIVTIIRGVNEGLDSTLTSYHSTSP